MVKLHQSMQLANNAKAADDRLLQWLTDNPADTAVRIYLGDSFLSRRQIKPAIGQYETALKSAPQNITAGFVVMNLLLSRLLRPRSTTDAAKLAIYECGEPTIGQAWIRFDIRFYTVALMFVVFDVEVALLFPWGVIFRDLVDQGLGGLAFVEAAIFLVILMVGLAYVWARGDIEWTASSQAPSSPAATPDVAKAPVREPALAGDPHG